MYVHLIASALEFLVCIPFGIYFWFRHKGSRLTRWLALIVIMLGLNGLQIFLELTLPPPAPGTVPWWLTPAWGGVGVSLLNVLINSFSTTPS